MFVALSAPVCAQLTDLERQGIKDALFVGNMREQDLDFARRALNPPYAFSFVSEAIDHPLATADALLKLHARTREQTPSQVLATVVQEVFAEPVGAIQHEPPLTGLDELAPSLRGPILGLVNWINSTNNEIKRATEKLTPEE